MQLIVEAFRMLGHGRVTNKDIKTIRDLISDEDREELAKHIGDTPVWMQPYLRRIIAE